MTTKRNRNNFIKVNVIFEQSKKMRFVGIKNFFTIFKNIGSIIFFVGFHYGFLSAAASLDMNPRQCFGGVTPTAANSRTA